MVCGGSSERAIVRCYQRARRRRNRVKIVCDILTLANEGSRKMQIMWRAKLGRVQLNDYLDFLLGSGLITKTEDADFQGAYVFQTTDKGREFLSRYSQLREIASKMS